MSWIAQCCEIHHFRFPFYVTVDFYTDEPMSARGFIAVVTEHSEFACEWIRAKDSEITSLAVPKGHGIFVIDCAACDPLTTAAQIRSQQPSLLVVLWARELPIEVSSAALALGIRGIVRKTTAADQIILALRVIAAGEVWLERRLASELFSTQQVKLTSRESELVMLVSRGLKNREIAEEMSLTEGTIKIYLSRLFEKTGAKDRLGLALLGLRLRSHPGTSNVIVRQLVSEDYHLAAGPAMAMDRQPGNKRGDNPEMLRARVLTAT